MAYYRYHYNVYVNGLKMKEHVSANNQQTAYFKVKVLHPMADRIVLIRTVHQY